MLLANGFPKRVVSPPGSPTSQVHGSFAYPVPLCSLWDSCHGVGILVGYLGEQYAGELLAKQRGPPNESASPPFQNIAGLLLP